MPCFRICRWRTTWPTAWRRKVDAAQRQRRARELLELVGLAEHAARAVTQLSGASSSVSLARALAIDPRACCWTSRSALDANVRAYLRDQIRALQRRFGATTLLVTHDQEEALAMADRVAVLKRRRC